MKFLKSCSTLLALLSLLCLPACKDIIEYKGQYLGKRKFDSNTEKDIVLFFNPESIRSQKNSEIIISDLKASAVPESMSIAFLENNIIQLRWNNQVRKLKIQKIDPCIRALSNAELLEICADNDTITVKFTETKSASNILNVSVKKTDNFDIFNNNNEYSIDELLGRTKFINYTVQQKAQEVYRAKLKISAAYGNLLPKLNLRNILGFLVSGPLSFIESIGNLAPFLFPSNWYKFDQSKDLHMAEVKSYASLRGNEMNTVESLIYLHQRNLDISKILEQELGWLSDIQKHLELREQVGDLAQGSSLLLSMKIATLLLDKQQLDLYLQTENSLLAQSIAFPITKNLKITALPKIDLSRAETTTPDKCFGYVVTQSHEITAIDYMIKASQNQGSETKYSYLDPSSDGTLGIGTPSLIRVGRSYEDELKVRKNEITSLLQKKCIDSVNERNNSIQTYLISQQYLKQAQEIKKILLQKIILEGNFSTEILLELVNNSENIIKLKSQSLSSEVQFLASESKLERLTLSGFYKNLEVGL